MSWLRNIFTKQNAPKILLLAAVYLLGHMAGAGRFTWREVMGTAWTAVVAVGSSAASGARDVVGF